MYKLFIIFLSISFIYSCATSVSEKNRKNSEVFYELGVETLAKSRLEESFRHFKKSVEENPRNHWGHYGLGIIYQANNDYDHAIESYLQAIQLQKNFSEAKNNLGICYMAKGQHNEAIKIFQDVLNDPFYKTPAHAYGNLGLSYYQQQDYQKAVHYTKTALKIQPQFCLGYKNLALIFEAQKEYLLAINYLRQFLSICYESKVLSQYVTSQTLSEIYHSLAKDYLLLHQTDKAIQSLESCIRNVSEKDFALHCQSFLDQIKSVHKNDAK